MAKQLVIMGTVGAGKSTLVKYHAKYGQAQVIDTDELYLTNPFFQLMLSDPKRWTFNSHIWFLVHRIEVLKKTLQKLTPNELVVIDSGLPMTYGYVLFTKKSGDISDAEWDLYQTLYAQLSSDLPSPDCIVYLKASVPFLLERIRKRGRAHELSLYNEDYIRGLNEAFANIAQEATAIFKCKVIEVDVEQLLNVHDQYAYINQEMSR